MGLHNLRTIQDLERLLREKGIQYDIEMVDKDEIVFDAYFEGDNLKLVVSNYLQAYKNVLKPALSLLKERGYIKNFSIQERHNNFVDGEDDDLYFLEFAIVVD